MSNYKLKQNDELQLWQDYKNGKPEARITLLRSVDPLLRKNVEKFRNSGLPIEAVETEARSLAAQAFDTYDPNKSQLNTHITNHLKHLQRFVIEYQNVAKIPENRAIAISKFHNIKAHLEDKLGREPNTVELSDELGWSISEVERMQAEQRKDLTMTSGEDLFYENQFLDRDETLEAIWYVYHDSDDVDKKILELLFGLMGNPKLSIQNIAVKINKSPSFVTNRYKVLADQIMTVRGIV